MALADTLRAPAAITALLAALTVVACGAATAAQRKATAAQAAFAGVAIPPGAIPWAAVPFQAYLPTPLPFPTATPAPQCSLSDLTVLPVSSAGATGNEALVFAFTNHTSRPCLTGGYPRVVLSQPGEPTLLATPGGFWDDHSAASDLDPGATARFPVGFSYECWTGAQPQLYEHVAVTLAGGGSFTTELSGVSRLSGQVPLGVLAQCGVSVAPLSVPPPQAQYPVDPLLSLVATVKAPATVRAGDALTYVITLANPTSQPIALDACRGYQQVVDSMKGPSFSYQLNCGAAHPIAAHGSESFVMQITGAGLAEGLHKLEWQLDTGGATGPQVAATFVVAA